MSKFKVGQKVVYKPKWQKHSNWNYPLVGEIVTIFSYSNVFENSLIISGYELSKDKKTRQHFKEFHFEPLVAELNRDRILYKLTEPSPPDLLKLKEYDIIEQPIKIGQ